MTAITFDTLKFTKKLEKAGLPPEQAESMGSDSIDLTWGQWGQTRLI